MPLLGDRMPESNPYRLGPFCLHSEIELPELPVQHSGTGLKVIISLRSTPEKLRYPLLETPACEANIGEYLLRVPGTGRFYVRDGEEVIIEPEAGAPELNIRAYLLGNIFSVLCHQRGLLPLHASAITSRHGAVAFLGDSGVGKSSLAAVLGRRGYPIVADDICLVDPEAPLSRRVIPVAPWLKLWQPTLDHLGESSADLPQIFSTEDKYRLALEEAHEPLPLAQVILLERSELNEASPEAHRDPIPAPARFREIRTVQAIEGLMRLTYRGQLPRYTGQAAVHFQRCGRALGGVRTFALERRWGFDAMPAVADIIEAHLRA